MLSKVWHVPTKRCYGQQSSCQFSLVDALLARARVSHHRASRVCSIIFKPSVVDRMGPGACIEYLAGELHPLVEVDVLYGSDRHASVSLWEPVDRRHHLRESEQRIRRTSATSEKTSRAALTTPAGQMVETRRHGVAEGKTSFRVPPTN